LKKEVYAFTDSGISGGAVADSAKLRGVERRGELLVALSWREVADSDELSTSTGESNPIGHG